MKYLKIFIVITFLMFSVSASAEFYKYVDDDGNVRFTDDINQVPEAQRSQIRSYIESENQEPAEQEVTQVNKPEQASKDQETDFSDLSDDESEMKNDGVRLDILCSAPYFSRAFKFHTDYSAFNPNLNVNFTA